MINKAIAGAIERVIRAYYKDETDSHLAYLAEDAEDEDELDYTVIAMMRNIVHNYDSRSSQHYTLDVSGYWQAGDGSRAADCYRDRRGLWVVNGHEVMKEFSDWIDSHYEF